MKLFSQLEGYDIISKLGDEMGALEDMIIDSTNWTIKGFVLKEGGLFKKERSIVEPADLKINDDDEIINLSPEAHRKEIEQDRSSVHHLYLSDLMKKKVVLKEGEDIGKVYDIEIATELKDWKVWKLFIRTGLKQRRLRIKPDQVTDLGEDVEIGLSKEEVEKLSKPVIS
ncbi:MAG: PRC-barrel domain-containing protein [Candidatus Thermoplasmatota archaeon]|nr:PRC-barrel domain-containing protein [Candidatus Thermoplasmatota archaeon]